METVLERRALLSTYIGIAMMAYPLAVSAAPMSGGVVSDADKAFVAKVSQGGIFEVEASKVANEKAVRADVMDTSVTEVHDHQRVGAKLKSIAETLSLPFPGELDGKFQARLDKLKALSGAAFDVGYIKEMDAIHATDVAAFAKEVKFGENPALKAFASETVVIVKRHIGSLHAVPVPTN